MEDKLPIKARMLTPIQLQMLDVGAPIIVTCQTVSGEKVAVRLQTANLSSETVDDSSEGAWLKHGAYVAIMPEGDWE